MDWMWIECVDILYGYPMDVRRRLGNPTVHIASHFGYLA